MVAEGNPFSKGNKIALVVAGGDSALGIPPQRRGLTLVLSRPGHNGSDQNGSTRDLGCSLDGTEGDLVLCRIDVGRVLRPQDEVRHRYLAESGPCDQIDGL